MEWVFVPPADRTPTPVEFAAEVAKHLPRAPTITQRNQPAKPAASARSRPDARRTPQRPGPAKGAGEPVGISTKGSAESRAPNPAPKAPPKITLRYLFEEQDFSHYWRQRADAFMPGADGTEQKFEVQLYWDYQTKAEFVGIFIPFDHSDFEALNGARAYRICEYMADHYREVFDLAKRFPTGGFIGETMKAEDLVFTGRVYIYSEVDLTPEQVVSIRALYRERGADVQVRGTLYYALKHEFALKSSLTEQ